MSTDWQERLMVKLPECDIEIIQQEIDASYKRGKMKVLEEVMKLPTPNLYSDNGNIYGVNMISRNKVLQIIKSQLNQTHSVKGVDINK